MKKKVDKEVRMPILNPHACGIDIGSKRHFVAVNQKLEDVRNFGVYTKDHQEMIIYLRDKGIQTIAMESTGNYWQTLYMALVEAGFEVYLVCGNQTKNVKGRKTDVQDCQWIQWLHSVGMLSHSFIPNEFVKHLRIYTRQRAKYVAQQGSIINQLQKSLRYMNVRLEVALDDVSGKSGREIIEAILLGERNPITLANLCDWRVKKSREEIAQALEGNWNEGYLFTLGQHYNDYKENIKRISECDNEIEKLVSSHLATSDIDVSLLEVLPKAKKKNKNKPKTDFTKYSYQYFGGVDLFQIEGVNQLTVMTLMSEVGTDITKFHSAKAFSNWLHLSPNEKITGGRVISSHTKRGMNPLSKVLRDAANAIGNMKINSHLCNFFKKQAYKSSRINAITATAHKLAVIIYNMLTKYQAYTPYQNTMTDDKRRQKKIKEAEKIIRNYQVNLSELNFTSLINNEVKLAV